MNKFDTIVNKYFNTLLEADVSVGLPQTGGPTAPTAIDAAPAAPEPEPAPEPAPEPEVKQLTSQGKIFGTELALRALAVDPKTISAVDKAIFNDPVTADNADEINDWITRIIGD